MLSNNSIINNGNVKNENGATLIIVMLVIVAVTALGLSAVNISTTEINLAGNDKWQKMGFYNGDPGVHGAPTVIAPNLLPRGEGAPVPPADTNDPNDPGCLGYIQNDEGKEFHDFVLNTPALDTDDPKCISTSSIAFRECDIDVDIVVCPRRPEPISGGGVEFASRAEGLGASGSEAKLFLISGLGDGAGNSKYVVRAHYRWVDAPGGLK